MTAKKRYSPGFVQKLNYGLHKIAQEYGRRKVFQEVLADLKKYARIFRN